MKRKAETRECSTYICCMFVMYERKLAGETKREYMQRLKKKYMKGQPLPNLKIKVIGWSQSE